MNERQLNESRSGEFICGVVEGFYGKPWTCEQRKDLFKRLRELKLNSFMYAPKDDTKHRAKWRQLYSENEAKELKTLIDEAKANGIDFYYSLAPGLDMIYSDPRELELLVEKYDQLVGLGCESFAILFDDIEPSIINDKDREMFRNYASAQIYVTNTIYNHLNRPKFLFCPTEYCESRAVPNVTNSIYLKTLGTGLLQGIDIMWSGCRVISRLITEESIETLTKVIKRPPLIWENLHANDYDKKRVFLGPYSGRSTKIISKLKGVLTNPNCEYEANYIAIHTLAQWSRCTMDINPTNSCNIQHDEKTSYPTNTLNQQQQQQIQTSNELIYDPLEALAQAIRDWLPRVLEPRSLPPGMNLTLPLIQRSDALASQQLAKEDDCDVKEIEVEENNIDMLAEDSRLSATSMITNKSDMDISGSLAAPNLIETNSCDSCEMQLGTESVPRTQEESGSSNVESQMTLEQQEQQKEVDCIMCSVDKSEKTETGPCGESAVKLEDLSLLVDLFYLPFEHGFSGKKLLKDIKWLRENHDVFLPDREGPATLNASTTTTITTTTTATTSTTNTTTPNQNRDKSMQISGDSVNTDMNCKSLLSWLTRAEKLDNLCTSINRLVNNLIYNCPNKLLIVELYPYLVDMRDVSTMIIDYIKFLRYRKPTLDILYPEEVRRSNLSKVQGKDLQLSGSLDEQEPWIHRGGLLGDVERLLS